MLRSVLSSAALAVTAVLVTTLAAATPAAAAPGDPVPAVSFRTAPEAPARYVGQVSCESTVKPGTLAFRQMILDTYGYARIGTLRACGSGGQSEHKQGRALDWMLDATVPADKAQADRFLQWLVGPDDQGVVGGNAHRLGVMYVIWNRSTWQAWNGAWKPYTGSSPHTDHIHISLSWDGAFKRTSWWTGAATQQYDYGPCQTYIGEPAPSYTQPRYSPCPRPRPRPALAFPRRWDADQTADVLAHGKNGELLMYPSNGWSRFRAKQQIGVGWNVMSTVTAVGDITGDGNRDLAAVRTDGRLYIYRGNGYGRFAGAAYVGPGWNTMDVVLGVGDLDADGAVDLLARRASDGAMYLYPGNGTGGFRRAQWAGNLAGHDLVTAVGDWSGDGQPDVVSRDGAGRLYLHAGDGSGRLRAPQQIGHGWQVMDALVGPGDFTGDGRADILARRTDGSLWVYAGNGGGRFLGASKVGVGWSSLSLVG